MLLFIQAERYPSRLKTVERIVLQRELQDCRFRTCQGAQRRNEGCEFGLHSANRESSLYESVGDEAREILN